MKKYTDDEIINVLIVISLWSTTICKCNPAP
jgi:hypothetical protein